MAIDIIENFTIFGCCEPFFAEFLPCLPKYWTEISENQFGIYFKAILSIALSSVEKIQRKKIIFLPKLSEV